MQHGGRHVLTIGSRDEDPSANDSNEASFVDRDHVKPHPIWDKKGTQT